MPLLCIMHTRENSTELIIPTLLILKVLPCAASRRAGISKPRMCNKRRLSDALECPFHFTRRQRCQLAEKTT